ncbi:PREDICTED: uncharacterized protein LOC109240564 [Nicotiana attenuata]|uniref:uncharacterized protein LOC109240564 n=1 Tax=Nicotiana attenuata TaxID=49451 RepID=UPI000905378B|nr:PREDICTED: uncharacterized protein LOC109240564 [Nicotiana attenuata]
MSNPQDNPGTPPQPTPSDSSTPPPPNTTPQPRRRRVKMLARKTVATGALSRKLNEKLKARQAQDSENSDDSFKSASEGKGTRSSDSEKALNFSSEVRSVLVENVDNRFVLLSVGFIVQLRKKVARKQGGSGSGEATEGLVSHSSQADESGSSIKDTLVDLLKKVGSSYDPKKRRTITTKAPSTAKPSKKRKASSPTTAEIPLPKGRATRRSKAAEPSLAERIRSAVKNKPVRIAEDEEWSGEDESESDD